MSSGSPEGIRLYDRIMAHGIGITANIPQTRSIELIVGMMDILRSSTVFNIQNVADYYFIHSQKDVLRGWKVDDFPNVAPPYGNYFMEFRLNRAHLPQVDPTISVPYAVGILTLAADVTKTPILKTAETQKWYTYSVVFTPFRKNEPVVPEVWLASKLDQYGRLVSDDPTRGLFGRDYDKYIEGVPYSDEEWTSVNTFARLAYFPTLLATTFLHCKGVTITEQKPDPGLSKAHQKRHGQPLIKFHTLDIRPMQEVLKREGDVEKTGLKRALHTVRGHFADYTEGRGLFGRHHGIFWMPQHIRGSQEQGLVVKDYDVHNPPATP